MSLLSEQRIEELASPVHDPFGKIPYLVVANAIRSASAETAEACALICDEWDGMVDNPLADILSRAIRNAVKVRK